MDILIDENKLQPVKGGYIVYIPEDEVNYAYNDEDKFLFGSRLNRLKDVDLDEFGRDIVEEALDVTFLLTEVALCHDWEMEDIDTPRLTAFRVAYHYYVDTSEHSIRNAFEEFQYTVDECLKLSYKLKEIGIIDEKKEDIYPYEGKPQTLAEYAAIQCEKYPVSDEYGTFSASPYPLGKEEFFGRNVDASDNLDEDNLWIEEEDDDCDELFIGHVYAEEPMPGFETNNTYSGVTHTMYGPGRSFMDRIQGLFTK